MSRVTSWHLFSCRLHAPTSSVVLSPPPRAFLYTCTFPVLLLKGKNKFSLYLDGKFKFNFPTLPSQIPLLTSLIPELQPN